SGARVNPRSGRCKRRGRQHDRGVLFAGCVMKCIDSPYLVISTDSEGEERLRGSGEIPGMFFVTNADSGSSTSVLFPQAGRQFPQYLESASLPLFWPECAADCF